MIEYLRKLFSFFDRATRWQIAGLFALMIAGAVLEFAGIAMIFPLVQYAINPEGLPFMRNIQAMLGIADVRDFLLILGGLVFAFFVLKNSSLVAITYIQNRLVNARRVDFTNALYSAYLNRPYADHIRQNSAEVIRNLTVSTAGLFINGLLAFMTLLMEGMLVAAVGAVLLIVEPVGTVIAGGVIGLAMGSLYAVTRRRLSVWSAGENSITATLIRTINESLAAFKEIRVLSRNDEFATVLDQANRKCANYRTNLAVVGQLPRFVGEIAVIGTVIAAITAMLLLQNHSPVDAIPILGAFAIAAMRILPSFNRIVISASAMRQSLPVVNELYRDYHAVASRQAQKAIPRATPFTSEIKIENASFRYPGASRPALSNVSLTIRRGEIVAFVGASGAGKSTLADLLLGLLALDSGRIIIDGHDIHRNEDLKVGRFGYVPQSVVLLDASLRDNIAFGLPPEEIDGQKIRAAAGAAQIGEFIAALPSGYDTMAGEHGVRMSGGQRQRIGIARALYDDPDILILDEATSALDSLTEDEFAQALEGLRGSKTIVIIAHRLTTIRKCDRLFFFSGGHLIESGTFNELTERSADFRRVMLAETSARPRILNPNTSRS